MGKNGSPSGQTLGASPPPVEKATYRIGEVSALTQLEPYVLRYWESEFPSLQPAKSLHGQRLYQPADVETILTIKRLLYEQGFTIAGARRQLEAGNGEAGEEPKPAGPPAAAPRKFGAAAAGATARERLAPPTAGLAAVRAELERLLTLLSRR